MTFGTEASWIRWLVVSLVLAVVGAAVAWLVAADRALDRMVATAETGVQLRTALLDSEVARFRLLPLALADDRDVVAALAGAADRRALLNRKLEAMARTTGASVIYLIGRDGRAISASNWREPTSFVGTDYGFRRYFHEARSRGSASQFALGTVSRRPGLYLARRTGADGVIVVKLEFDGVEAAWRRAGGESYVTDRDGVVVVTSRPDSRFRITRALSSDADSRIRRDANLGTRALGTLSIRRTGNGRARLADGTQMATASIPAREDGWRVTLLLPSRAAVAGSARIAAITTALAVLALAALAWAARERTLLAHRRTAELEALVSDRTASLRHEMDERAASEGRAAELREGLRQANRLASLGQITASVAHETAQPVAAIRTYAQSSKALLDRGDTAQVIANLAAIARLTDRIGAVTSQLRGFSRRGAGSIRPVLLAEVMDGAALILKDQLRSVTLHAPTIDQTLAVLGGKVRLEQVLVNLLQNAVEALSATADPRIEILCDIAADTVRLTVRDNGPGIAPEVAEKLFMPFVTSRESGLGLGLVIALDIMTDLDGSLRLIPSSRGAAFEIAMRRA